MVGGLHSAGLPGGVITALRLFGEEGKKWPAVGSLMAALVVAAPGVVALFGLDWNLITPISIICVGLVLLISFFFNR